jgi:hypothetical protein
MDIEGSEWEVLASADPTVLGRFRQVVVECHGLLEAATDPERFEVVVEALRRIHGTHQPIHVHPNNNGNFQVLANVPVPDVIEISYARRRDYRFTEPGLPAGAGLVRANDPGYPDIVATFPIPRAAAEVNPPPG